jgi:hypothetical protein
MSAQAQSQLVADSCSNPLKHNEIKSRPGGTKLPFVRLHHSSALLAFPRLISVSLNP